MSTRKDPRRARGDRGERIAAKYLEDEGWTILDRNVHFRVGELDVIADDGDQIVFVEVRSRWSSGGPLPENTVTYPKQRRLTRAARMYLVGYPDRSARFDVIGVDLRCGCVTAHLRDAFEASRY